MNTKLTFIICIAAFSAYAQKKELKEAEKLIEASKFQEALPLITSAEAKLGGLKAADKTKLFRLKALSLTGNKEKASLEDYKEAIKAYNKVLTLEKATKSIKYTPESLDNLNKIDYAIEEKAQNYIKNKEFNEAAMIYDYLYTKNTQDTIFLYNKAISYISGKEYDKSLETYQKLLDLGYTGKGEVHKAKHAASGEEHVIQTKADMDALVAKGEYSDPKTEKLPSKRGEITKNIALIYLNKGDEAKAAEAFKMAREANPEDQSIVDSEVNMYFLKGIELSKAKDFDTAITYYKKVLDLNPSYADANYNIAAILLQRDGEIVDKINALDNKSAGNTKYKALREQREANFNAAIPYMEKYLELKPEDKAFAENLLSIYKAVKSPKMEAFKAKHGL